LSHYRETFLAIWEDWSQTTTYEDATVTEDDIRRLLRLFRNTLGGESRWENE